MVQTCHPVPGQVVSHMLTVQIMCVSFRCYHMTLILPTKIIGYVDHRNFFSVKGCLILFNHCTIHLFEEAVPERFDVFVDDAICVHQTCWGVIPVVNVNSQCMNFNALASHFEHKVDKLGQINVEFSVIASGFSVIVTAYIFTDVSGPITTDEHSLRFIFVYEYSGKVEDLILFSQWMA